MRLRGAEYLEHLSVVDEDGGDPLKGQQTRGNKFLIKLLRPDFQTQFVAKEKKKKKKITGRLEGGQFHLFLQLLPSESLMSLLETGSTLAAFLSSCCVATAV